MSPSTIRPVLSIKIFKYFNIKLFFKFDIHKIFSYAYNYYYMYKIILLNEMNIKISILISNVGIGSDQNKYAFILSFNISGFVLTNPTIF